METFFARLFLFAIAIFAILLAGIFPFLWFLYIAFIALVITNILSN